jgi:hypothetical protein
VHNAAPIEHGKQTVPPFASRLGAVGDCAAIRPIPIFAFSSGTGQTASTRSALFQFFFPRPASVILKRGAPSQRPRAYCVASSLCPGLSIGATGGPRYSPELRGARYMIPSFVQQPSNVKCPHCPRCQGRMVLARIRASSICEKRSFDCPYCNFIETQIVDDPVRTNALVRLANSIRPPT